MPPLNIRRIRHRRRRRGGPTRRAAPPSSAPRATSSRRAAQALTVKVFGEPLTPAQVVERDLRRRAATRRWRRCSTTPSSSTACGSTPETLRVSRAELAEAHAAADPGSPGDGAAGAAERPGVPDGHPAPRRDPEPWPGMHELRLRYRPLRRVGVCVPGGAAAYPSTLLMTVVPGPGGGRQGARRGHAADAVRRRTTPTCWPSATSWA